MGVFLLSDADEIRKDKCQIRGVSFEVILSDSDEVAI
jgi:hypothetical protein